MTISSRSRRTAALAVLAAGAMALSACSSGGGGGGGDKSAPNAKQAQKTNMSTVIGTAADSKGPAAAVPGSTPGGTLNVFQRDNFAHTDPAQIYVSDQGQLATMIHRGLTGYKMSDDGKKYTVVGDLAQDPGKASDGGRTWTFKLKSGIKWQDGTPITSDDIRWSVERTFASWVTQGPKYLQQWLANTQGATYNKFYSGPYKGQSLPKSSLETPDKQTIVFHFKTPHPDLPYTMAMPGYSAVEKAKDTKQKYDKAPQASGPYKIQSWNQGKEMILAKNTNWDPKTDPIRHQFPDKIDITFAHQASDVTNRLSADSGSNKTSVSWSLGVDPGSVQKVISTPSIKSRMVQGYQSFNAMMAFNMDHLKDMRVRKAIALAMPIKSVLAANGGAAGGELAGSYMNPTLAGWKQIDPYGKLKKPEGDPAAAKKLLKQAGKVGMKLTYAYANSEANQKSQVSVTSALKQAGFNVQPKELPADTYYDLIGEIGKDNKFDIYQDNWGADWPSASTVIPPDFDGRTIAKGAPNYSHFNEPSVNKRIDEINKITDPNQAAKAWMDLNQTILTKYLPGVPIYNWRQMQLYGSKVGGAVYNNVQSAIDPTRLYIKK